MSELKATPGPWSKHDCFDPTGKRLTSRDIVPRGGHSLSGVVVLASVFSNEHDARLIAAAPELYEAAHDFLEAWTDGQTRESAAHLAIKLGRALRKARGDQ
jgi:hypothetical protein